MTPRRGGVRRRAAAGLVAVLAAVVPMTACAGGDRSRAQPPPGPPATPDSSVVPPSPAPTTAPESPTTVPPSPPTGPAQPLAGRTVVLDPGHNGRNWAHLDEINRLVDIGVGSKPCNTTGTASSDGYAEATFTWQVARLARSVLEDLGARVVLTRADNDGWGPCIDERAEVANRARADAAVAIHADGGPPDQRGFHVIHPLPVAGLTDDIAGESRRLALAVRDAYRRTGIPTASYVGAGGLSERGDLGGLTLSDVPVVFLEAGNMRHPADAALLVDPAFQAEIAGALASGLVSYLG